MDVSSTWRRLAGESRGVLRIGLNGRVEFAGKGEIEPTDAAALRAFFIAMGRELELGEPRELATASTSGAAIFLDESTDGCLGHHRRSECPISCLARRSLASDARGAVVKDVLERLTRVEGIHAAALFDADGTFLSAAGDDNSSQLLARCHARVRAAL